MHKPAKVIGEGGFGLVTDEGKLARKQFKRLDHLVRELIMLRYMRPSGYIVKVESHNFWNLTMCCKKWHGSLRDTIIRHDIKPEHKLQIFKDILYGLCHIHRANFVHSDVTLSNILVDTKAWRACLCDLGLSSITDYSRVHQTARGYAPEKPVPCQGHDMFGLSVCMLTLFGDIKIDQRKNASQLRQLIRVTPGIPSRLRAVLCKMCPDDPRKAITSSEVLWEIFNEKTTFTLPEIEVYTTISVAPEILKFLKEQITTIADVYKINRKSRCYRCLIQFFSGPTGSQIDEKLYDLYMVTALYVFACLYGRSLFNKDEALQALRGDYSEEDFLTALQIFVQDNNFIASALVNTR